MCAFILQWYKHLHSTRTPVCANICMYIWKLSIWYLSCLVRSATLFQCMNLTTIHIFHYTFNIYFLRNVFIWMMREGSRPISHLLTHVPSSPTAKPHRKLQSGPRVTSVATLDIGWWLITGSFTCWAPCPLAKFILLSLIFFCCYLILYADCSWF